MEIIEFAPQYSGDFKRLNVQWLEEFFFVEPHDEEVLGNPQKYILEPGGSIFFARENEQILGTVALMKMEDRVFELTKMAVNPEARGKRIGQQLMAHGVAFAREQGWERLIIYSNRKLENAIHIYRKFGFEEIPMESGTPYERADIKMELKLS